VCLLGADDVAAKQDYACGLDSPQQIEEPRRHFRAVEADDQKLSELLG
jgi:hypothetical protein